MPISIMLNNTEVYIRECIKRGLPMNIVSTIGMKPSLVKNLEENQDYEELGKLILTDNDDASRAFHREQALQIPAHLFAARDDLKRELIGSTGVRDSQRGQLQKGERTALEFRATESAGGVQARHMRKQYAKFLYDIVDKSRRIGALFEKPENEDFVLQDGFTVTTNMFDLSKVLSYPMELRIHEESLNYQSADEKMQKRLALFNNFEAPLLQGPLGQMLNPAEILKDVYKHFGYRDTEKFLTNPQMGGNVLQGGSSIPPQGGVNPSVPGGGTMNSPQ